MVLHSSRQVPGAGAAGNRRAVFLRVSRPFGPYPVVGLSRTLVDPALPGPTLPTGVNYGTAGLTPCPGACKVIWFLTVRDEGERT